jgi:hypothetical protein
LASSGTPPGQGWGAATAIADPSNARPPHAPAEEFALEEIVRRQTGSILTSQLGSNRVRTTLTDTPALSRRRESLSALSGVPNAPPSASAPHVQFDRLEFAEHLRTALIEDARRHGIEI